MGKVMMLLVFLGLVVTVLGNELKQDSDNVAESSVTSYSTVVIHHPPPGKKSNLVKDGEEGRSEAYFKVKRLKASTVPLQKSNVQNGHNGGDFRLKNPEFRVQNEEFKAQNNDFRPSQYLPEPEEIRVSFRANKDQSVQAARNTEYRQSKDQRDPELRGFRYEEESNENREPFSWNQHYHDGLKYHVPESKRTRQKQKQQEAQHHRETYRESYPTRNEEQRINSSPQQQNVHTGFSYQAPQALALSASPADIRHPFEHFTEHTSHAQALEPIPPPGMSPELIETLLSQQPQTFDTEKKPEPKKKSKSQTFKVGYSIGFGGGEDVVMGRPKDVHLHVNGRNSVWKTLPNGVEMSEEVDRKKPTTLKLHDSSSKSNENVLKNDVYYINNYRPDISVPTSGRSSFDHAQALTHSNSFDFSNAMDPKWPKQIHHQPRTLDMSSLYQNLGYPAPLPVLLPGQGPHGEGTMVQAIVIPIESLAGLDYTANWAGLQQVPMVPVAAQPVAQALTLNPVVTAAPLNSQTQPPQHLNSQPPQHLSSQPSQHLNSQPSQHLNSLAPQRQSSPQHLYGHEKPRYKTRVPKAKDSVKQGSFNSAPIVVAPTAPNRQVELQKELNNILAEEMHRKNHRMPAVGLRPPPPF